MELDRHEYGFENRAEWLCEETIADDCRVVPTLTFFSPLTDARHRRKALDAIRALALRRISADEGVTTDS